MNMDERLMELYTLAFAPLGPDTLLGDVEDLSADDITPDVVTDEVKYLKHLMCFGMKTFSSYLDQYGQMETHSAPPEVGTAVACLSSFLRRIHVLNHALIEMTDQLSEDYADYTTNLKSFESQARSDRRPVDVASFSTLFDLTPNCKWLSPDAVLSRKPSSVVATDRESVARVGFKETTTIFTEGDAKSSEEALKVFDFKRKKNRNPTGFAKFTFRASDLQLDSSEAISFPSTSASSVIGHDNSEAASSYTARSDSLTDEIQRQEELNPFAEGVGRRSSSVNFSFDREREEIEDEVADPNWNTETRHVRRFSRIRARVPTGHPALMKKTSDDLQALLQDIDHMSSRGDLGEREEVRNKTRENTKSNALK